MTLSGKIPYFMTNEAWYEYDFDTFRYVLTAEGMRNPKVAKSYNDYYSEIESQD